MLQVIAQFHKEGGKRMSDLKITPAAARVNAGLTQRDVAEKMGVSTNTVINWENGKTVPSVSMAWRLSELYGIPLDNIFFAADTN